MQKLDLQTWTRVVCLLSIVMGELKQTPNPNMMSAGKPGTPCNALAMGSHFSFVIATNFLHRKGDCTLLEAEQT